MTDDQQSTGDPETPGMTGDPETPGNTTAQEEEVVGFGDPETPGNA